MKCWATKIPANFLSTIFILIASFSIHEFYFAALNKGNYFLPLFCVAHFEHTDFLKAGGPGRGRSRKALAILCPLAWPAPHLAMPNYSHFLGFLCWVSVNSWGETSMGRGALEVRQQEWSMLMGGRGGQKRSLILEECLAVMLENGKVWCSCVDHCKMKLSSARLFWGGTGGERHNMGIRASKKVR